MMQKFFPEKQCAILEIGPGTGEVAQMFLEDGYENYTVVEPNNGMRHALEKKGIQTKNYRIPPLLEKDNTYDVLILIHVFEHLNDAKEAEQFFLEAHRVLKPGGLLCLNCPDYLHAGKEFFNCCWNHSNTTTVLRTSQLCTDYGFSLQHCVYYTAFFTGLPATIISRIAQTVLCVFHGSIRDKSVWHKLYKLRWTFMRQFFVIAKKE